MQYIEELEEREHGLARKAAHADDRQLGAKRAQRAAPHFQAARRPVRRWLPRWQNEPDSLYYMFSIRARVHTRTVSTLIAEVCSKSACAESWTSWGKWGH